jgi:HSP20 family molecular chaperone IbpA
MCAQANPIEGQQTQAGQEAEATRARPVFLPCTDIFERADAIVVTADMPGVGPEAVDVDLVGNELTISGRVEEASFEGHELSYAEYEVGDYQRRFRISGGIEADKIDATIKNGVLQVVLPKSKEAQPQKITVKPGS